MRLFNRFGGESHKGEKNRENRGRNDQGNRRAKGARNIIAERKLGLEALEERQLLSVNPIGSAEYQDIRASYANLSLPEDFNKINVIEISDLTAASLQSAVDQAALTPTDDLVVLRTDSNNYTLNLESTAVTVNIDSTNYGKLTVVGFGTDAPVIETVNSNAFTVLNGDVTFDGAVVYNYSNIDYAGDSFVGTKDAQITLGDTLVVVNQTTKTDETTGELTTSYAVDRVATAEELEQAGISNSTATSAYRTINNPHGDGDDYNGVRNSVHAVMRSQYDYFGYNPATYWASGLSSGSVIYDAESVGYAGWVGTVANMLAYTGWAQQAGFSTRMTLSDGSTVTYNSVEDAVAAYLMNGFINTGAGTAYNWSITAASILDYFFTGNDENCFGRNYSALTNTIEGGGFFQNIDFGKVGGYTAASDTMLQEMLSVLRKGNAVTMEVQTSDSYGNVSREYVSVWGYVYNRDSRVYYGNTTNEAATTVGLICSNPTKSAYEQQVTDSRYNNTENNPRTLTHYVERNSTQGDVYDTYHTYLLSGSGSNLTLVHAPYTYLDSNGAVQGAINFPENFCFYGNDNTSNNTYTSRILGFSWLQQYSANLSSVEINQNSVLSLESMPGNTDNVIYLYFGGVDGTADGVEHPEFTLDNSAGYSAAELKMIEEIWRRVAEDYAPFNVNVTTSASVWASASRGVRCVIGGYHSDHGGVSGVGIFGASKSDNYVYPFSLGLSAKNIAEAASHEVGHSLGLSHDGYEHSGYYDGDYSGNTTWAPIMGTAYGAAISQWSKGEYVGATNLEDDIAIISSNLGFRPDDAGDTVETASDLANFYVGIDINSPSATAGTYNVVGYIETRDDYDVYSFKSYGGTYVVDVVGDGADDRYIDSDFSWTTRRHSDTENAAFAGLYYAKSYDYTNLNLKVELLDEEGEIVLLDKNGSIMKLSFGESIVLRDSDYYFYVVDQFGRKVYDDAGNLKEGYQAVDDSVYTTFSHFVTPKLEEGKTYYIRVTGVGEGNPSTTGYSDYGSLGKYTLSLHESYENFRIDAEQVDVSDLTYATGVDNVLNWQEAFVYANRRLENGRSYLGNTLTFNESLTGSTLNLRDTLLLTRSTSITGQPYSPKRFVFNAMNAWDTTNDQPGITINANEKFRAVYVDNTTVEMYGFTITGGVAETSSVIYLYFGGLEEGDTGWSGELHPALDFDGDPTSFSSEELEVINEVYLRVAEDYAPYNVTVTTDQSVFEAATNAIRVVIGGTGNGRGGVAYVGSFGTQKQDCYVFPNSTGGARNAKGIAEAVSHEVGHTMGLGHDGIDSSEYYGGSGLWGPIMGSPYGSTITQWSKGEYAGATNSQDDIAIIAGRLGFKEDDYGDTIKDASALSSSYLNAGNLVADGIITNEKDVDFFYFVAMDSTYVIDVVGSGADFSRTDADGYATSLRITNIDLLVKVYDENGTLLYTCDPTDSVFAHFQIDGLEVGEKYYFSVEGTGFGDPKSRGEGYSAYGSIGQFYVTVSATTLANFVGEERYESVATKKAIQTAAAEANYIKGETYDQVGQTNNGGGVYNHYGWLTIGNSVIAGNRAYKAGGGVYNQGGEYRNTDQHDGWLYLVNTSIVGNFATSENAIGGGVYNEDGGVVTLVNATVAGNTADYSGGGLENAGIARAYNSIIGNNVAKYGADVYTEAGNSTYVYSSLVGDESRNSSLLAQRGGEDSYNADGYSIIGKSAGTTVNSAVTTYDPGFVAYRDYDRDEWSQELWKFWNLRLSAESLAVDLGANYLSSNLDYTNGYVQASKYNTLKMSRYFTEFPKDLAGQTRVGGPTVDAGSYELLAVPELTGYIPTSAGSDVVNNWENSIVISRAVDDQTGSIAPFLVDETLYLNLSFINEGAKIADSFETTVYLWKFDAYTKKADMYAQATQETGVPIMTIRVDFVGSGTFPGGAATVTCTNLATGDVQTFDYDGSTSYLVLENVTLGSVETIVSKLIEKGDMPEQNEEGYYLFGYGIDSANEIAELRENNNFFRTTSYFDVVESPVSINDSIVVTTDLDVVDPYDGLISLREAVEVYAGSYYYREIALQEGDTFEANGVTYVVQNGKFYVDSSSSYQVYPGEQFFVDTEVEITATWDETNGVFVDGAGAEITVPAGTTIIRGGVEYVYNGLDWLDASSNPYAMTDGETVSWTENQTTVVTYVQNVYLNADRQMVDVPNGTIATIGGTEYELVDGVWTHTEVTHRYDRDAIQRMGVFTLEDGTEVAIVNGVFRRVATNDVAIVRDGAVVTLADGSTAVYHYAQDRFVVTEVTTVILADGDEVEIGGETLVFATDEYVDATGTEYILAEGTEVTLSNGYEVVYRNGKFIYKTLTQNVGKIAAGTEVIWNGESFTYKAGLALMQRVSRESNAVVFNPPLDGATFVLVDGPLTLDKTFTLDCVDPDGNLLDLTITSSSDDPCLFKITEDGDATVLNFKFVNATSTETGSIFENEGVLTLENVTFENNTMGKGNLIYNAPDAKLTVLTSSFSGNTATEGALIYNLGDASIIGTYDEGTTNTVYTSFVGDSAFLGAIYNGGGTLAVQYVDFQKTSAENGGAIHVNGGSATIANDVFTETTASGMGGAIFATNGAKVQIDDVSFSKTTATKGGAIVVHSDATANVTTATFDSTSATEEGGAIYNNSGTINIEGATFTKATATDGGAIYNAGATTLVSPVFDSNVATNKGGAIYSEDGSGLTFNANEAGDPAATFTNNSANEGGALYADTPVSFNGDLVATGNSATESCGAIYVHGRLNVTGAATFENNTATNVGALGVEAEATLGAVRFANNSSTGNFGAAYFGLTATVDSLELVDNTTAGDGSALYVASVLKIGDYAILSGNEGGAIEAGSDVTIGGSLTATDNVGGAITASGSITTEGDATIKDNTSKEGGAINATGLVLIKGSATVSGNTATTGAGGAFKVGSFEVRGEFNASDNSAVGDGGVIYSDGAVKLTKATFENNETQGSGGAVYSNGDVTIAYGTFIGNKATTNAGAVYAGAGLSASNTLFAENVAGGLGGAIYGAGTTSLVNVTIASNEAADGAGLYNAGVATIDNSILANNVATGSGYDLFTATGAKTTLRGSLLANVAQIGDVAYTLDAAYRSLLGVDPQLDGNYRLTTGSLAINTGFNELDGGAETDLNGDARRVGLTIGGVVRTVDMGAYEFQTVVAPDLAIVEESVDFWQTEVVVDGGTVELAYFLEGQDVCINFNAKNIGDATVVDNFKYNVTLVGVDSHGNEVYRTTQAAVSYAQEFEVFDWLSQSDWIYAGDEQRLVANFGTLPVGYYTVTVALDVEGVGVIYEWGEEDTYVGTENNNLYESTFTVKELPSTIVTTAEDVVDEVDGKTSLREAINNAASYEYVTTFLVADGTQFTTEGGEVLTVTDGWLVQKVDVVYKNGVAYDLQEGDEFLLNGKKIYYHYQLNGGYFAYANGNVADVSSGTVTYPDGSEASFDLQTEQYIHYVDDSELNYREGDRYTYNVLRLTSGDVILRDGMQFDVQNVKFTYVQNAAYPSGAFLFEDGSIVEYADGADLAFESLAIGTLSTRNARVEDSVVLEDGSTLFVEDGVAKLTRELTPVVTFASNLQGATITVDPVQGPLDVTLYADLGKRVDNGEEFYLARVLSVEGEDRAVIVSGANATRIMNVEADATVTVSDLAFQNGLANAGGAVFNEGDATFRNVEFSNNNAIWQRTTTGGDALRDGLGGAIINYGTLAVEGGLFSSNGVLPESANELELNGTTEFGGAIFSAGETTIKGASFVGNEAYAGGAIAATEGTLTVENSSFSKNVSERAAAIYTLIPTTVVASSFTENTAEATSFTSRNVNGGAIYAREDITFKADPNSESTVAVTFSGNKAEIAGALYAEKNAVVLGDIVATNNSAVKNEAYATDVLNDYGAVYVGGTLTVDGNATFAGNSASGSYGAAYVGGTATVNGAATFNDNTAAGVGAIYATSLRVGSDLTATGNSTDGAVGAIMLDGTLNVLGGANLSNNTAREYGAVQVGGSVMVKGDATISGNKAIAGSYGAIYAVNSVAITGSATIADNAAGGDVGAIYATSLKVEGDLTATGNTASGEVGAFKLERTLNVVGDATISDNSAATFGAALTGGSVTIAGAATIANNSATTGSYGAIFTPIDLNIGGDASIVNNTAVGDVGAIYAKTVFIGTGPDAVAVEISGNKAGASYGAAYVVGAVTINGNATVANNSAVDSVGAISAKSIAISGDALISKNKAGGAYGAIAASTSMTVGGSATVSENEAGSNVGAIYAKSFTVDGAATITKNVAGGDAGAIYAVDSVSLKGATITGNTAGGIAGAILANSVELINSLVANNAATGDGGAIYASELTLVNVTVACNSAANGGGLYVEKSAAIDNSILAGNTVGEGGSGVDIYTAGSATITLRCSLLQNAESTGEKAFGEDWLVADYRSFIGTDPLFTDAANGDFTLKATSPIVNSGSNELATKVGEYDLAGAPRYVGLVVGGDVYAIDIGAYEFQTITAADLAFSDNPVNFWYGALNGADVDYYFVGEDVILDFSFLNSGDALVTDKFSVSFTINGVTVDGSNYDQTVVYRYVAGSQYFDWLDEANWISAGDSVSYARQNLGALPIGSYTLTITLDVNDEVTEYGEEDGSEAEPNNVYTANFEVHEVPSVVVTTKEDGAYNPLDDKVTLREAVELYAGPTSYTQHVLVDSATYVDADMNVVTVTNGVATSEYNVVRLGGEETAVSDGDTFGYRNTYVTYDPKTATFTYPDGNVEYYARTNYLYSLTLTAADGSQYVVKPELKIEYLENIGQPYSDTDLGVYVDVVISPDGVHTLLEDVGDETILYGTDNLTYRQFVATNSAGVATALHDGDAIALRGGLSGTFKNGAIVAEDGSYVLLKSGDKVVVGDATLTWVGSAFVYEDGDNKAIRFVDGATVETLKGTLEMGVAQKTITGNLDLADGSSVVFNEDGSTTLIHYVDNNVVFSDKLVAKPVVIKLDGSEIVIGKDLTINAPGVDNVTVDGGARSGVFAVNANVEATISTLKLINGSAITGGAIANYGTLTLNDVGFSWNKATSDGTVDSDKILHEGLGGAIFNTGTLAVNGGQFESNTSAFFGGAIYSVGALAIDGAKFTENESGLNGGAVFVLNSNATIADAVFANNFADRNGGAVAISVARNSGAITITNSMLVDNEATSGGAVYAYAGPEGSASASLVNDTIAGNAAEVGGGVYAEKATVSLANTIVATNVATEGVDIALVSGATATATNSLIGDGENIGTADALTAVSSLVGTTEAPIDPKFASEYSLDASSPAINSGSNELAVYADGSAIETDVNGGVRIVGVEKDGVIYAVDMGAIEYQKVVAPDLTFPASGSALSGWYTSVDGESTGEFVEGWEVCFDYTFGNYGQASVFNSFNYTITIAKLDENGAVVEGSEKSYARTYGEEVDGFLPTDQALAPNAVVSDTWNLGVFDAGQYAVTFTVDYGDKIAETNEDNNVYTTTFFVAERPSLVVTTAEDVIDAYDGFTSLREAIGRVSGNGESTISEPRALENGDSFTLAAYEELGVADGTVATYADGAITFVNEAGETVALQTGVAYPLSSGGELTFLGGEDALLSETSASLITFDPSVYGATITLTGGELVVDRSMEINGDGASVVIDANGGRAFMVAHGDEIVIRGLTVVKGDADKGAAIYNAANLVLTNMTFTANSATENGGAIFNADGASLNASNVAFTTNSAAEGGAVYNVGELALSEATFTSGNATTGAAIYNAGSATIAGATFANGVAADRAGAIYNVGTLDVMNANVSANTAQYGGAIVNYQGRATIADTTFSENVATRDAGAIDNYGELMLSNVEFSGNRAQGFGGAIYNSMSSTSAAYLVELDGVSFTGNSAARGGAIYNSTRSVIAVDSASNFSNNVATEDGGAIYNVGTFASDVAITFVANEAEGDGGALYNGAGSKTTLTGASFDGNVAKSGGAVYNAGTFNATTSNFESNVAATDGGAVNAIAGSTTSVSNSVVWKNSAGASGGAIVSAGTLKLRNTTIAGNSAAIGGGLATSNSTSLYNTIVADNYAPKGTDLYSTRSASVYYSLIGVTSGSNVAPTMVQSKTGDPGFVVEPVFADGVLSNASEINLALKSSSAAVNSGNDAWALDATGEVALDKDFAGNDRICTSLDSVDMGAYEFPFEEPSTVVNTDKDVYDLTDGVISIREAIDYAVRLGQDTVTIDPSVTNIELGSTLEINDSVKIVAEAEGGLTLESNGFNGSVVAVGTTTAGEQAEVELENVTITGGVFVNPLIDDDPNYIGGGLCNYATLTLTNVTVDGNRAAYGGGFYNAGSARVIGSTIMNNTANYYGGIYNRGELYVEDSTIAGNTAVYYGGGLGTYTDATIVNSTIVGNVAKQGAGVYEQVNASDLLTSDTEMATTIVNSTITGNVATEFGAGVWANHVLNVDNSIVYGNVAPKNADLYYTTIIGTSVATFRYSNVGVSNVKVTGTGVKSVDPGFKSYEKPTAGTASSAWKDWDLTLAIGSAMIDAGSTALARGENGELTLDHAGLTRVVNASVDIGAYEEQGNSAPTDIVITLSDNINSALTPGSVIATLDAVDPDGGDAFTYQIVADDSGVLAIDGDKVVVTGELPAGDYTATIAATDEGGASVEKTFEFVVSDPSATNYATPTITTIGVASSGDVVVAWSTDDPAKEYVVEYRVKGTSKWQSTGSLTGTFGTLVDANFKVGDVVQARIKALTSSTKNESAWSDVVEYEIAAPTPSYNVTINENAAGAFHVASVAIESNVEPYAWWAIDWNDGSAVTSVTGLSMSQTLSHIYTTSGVYTPVLYVDNQEGVALSAIVVNVATSSGAVLDVVAEPVFSEIEPIDVYGPVPVAPEILVYGRVHEDSAVAFQTSDEEIKVESAQKSGVQIVVDALAAPTAARSSIAIDAFFAGMGQEDDELDTELDDTIFNDDFIGELFED